MNYHRMAKVREFFAKMLGNANLVKKTKKKKVMGPGIGTNRMRRIREGKSW